MKLRSPLTQQNRFSKQNMMGWCAMVAGVTASLGLFIPFSSPGTRFQFQQPIGAEILSGSFEARDANSDGRFELSEIKNFQATWGDTTWSQGDLEAFVWQPPTSTHSDQPAHLAGFNLFARHQQPSQTQVLQIRHTAPDKVQVTALEYGQTQPDQTLFSVENLPLAVKPVSPYQDFNSVRLFLAVGLLGLFLWQPCTTEFSLKQEPLQSFNPSLNS